MIIDFGQNFYTEYAFFQTKYTQAQQIDCILKDLQYIDVKKSQELQLHNKYNMRQHWISTKYTQGTSS